MRFALLLITLACVTLSMEINDELSYNLCNPLKSIIETPIFNIQFSFSKNQGVDFIIIDTSNFFSQCDIDTVHNRKVIISDTLYPKELMIKDPNIVIATVEEKDSIITFGFWCQEHGGTLAVHYERKESELKLLGYRTGDI